MNCNPDAIPAVVSSRPIYLRIEGAGQICAFKNRKRAIVDKRSRKLRTLTDPSVAKRMEQITLAIISELLCVIPITENGILMEQQVRSWIASNMPYKDSRQWIPSLYIDSENCAKGEEGATIIIEKL